MSGLALNPINDQARVGPHEPGRHEPRVRRPPMRDSDAACAFYLNRKLVRSSPKVGFQITFPRSIALETNVDNVRLPKGAQGACSM